MPNNIVLMTGIRFLHDLATAVWIGGLITMGLAVLPALKRRLGLNPQTRQLMLSIQKRLRLLVFASIVVLVVTGALLSRRSLQFRGLFSWANPYSAALAWKHLLVIAMVVIALVRGLALRRAPAQGEASPRPGTPAGALGDTAPRPVGHEQGGTVAPAARDRISGLLLLLNILLGVGVVLLSALSTVIAKGGPQ